MRTKIYASPKLKEDFDAKAAVSHKKGDSVVITLSALDKKWGRYYYPMRTNIHYSIFLDMQNYYNLAVFLLEKVRKVKVRERQNARFVFDEKLLDDIFLTVSKYVLSYYMTLEYFVTESLWILNNANDRHKLGFQIDDEATLLDRIKSIDNIIEEKKVLPASLNVIINQRDFLMHPTFRRIFPTDQNQNWKENLIGWFLSGEIEGSFDEFEKYLDDRARKIEKFISSLPNKKLVLKVNRGVVAKEPVKNTSD